MMAGGDAVCMCKLIGYTVGCVLLLLFIARLVIVTNFFSFILYYIKYTIFDWESPHLPCTIQDNHPFWFLTMTTSIQIFLCG